MELDEVDRDLLRLLQEDNQQTVRALAERTRVSAPTCLRRIRALRRAGVIRHDAALIDPAKVGLNLHCQVLVALDQHSAAAVQTFGLRMLPLPQVVACSEISGAADFLLHVIVRDMEAFSNFALTHLASDRNIKSYQSLFVIRRHKADHRLPL